jgi:hypothetical protein
MLRAAVLVLVLANAAFYAWSHKLLASWGYGPQEQSEPQRIAQQIEPEAVRILSPDEVRRNQSAAPANAPQCYIAGLFDDAQATALKQALTAWPEGSWSMDAATEPARWIVYMGKYLTVDNVNRKKAELRQLGVSFEPLANAALEPGLSLGGYPTEAAAKQQLDALATHGVRTAKVVQERPEARGQQLRLPAVDDTLRARLDDLKAALAGKTLRPCR